MRYWWAEGDYPLTKWIIAINVFLLLASAFFPVAQFVSFVAPTSWIFPWTALTYPLFSPDPIGLLFYGLLLWFVGGSLERSWGTRFYAIYFAAMSVITALGMSLGAWLYNAQFSLSYYLPLAALFLAWAMLNPNLEIRLYGIIPILAKWLALGQVLIIFFTHSSRAYPLLGFFALSGCAASYYWVRTRAWRDISLYSSMPNYTTRAPKPKRTKRNRRDDDFSIRDLNPLEKIARARRKKQFERLMDDDESRTKPE